MHMRSQADPALGPPTLILTPDPDLAALVTHPGNIITGEPVEVPIDIRDR